MGLPKTFTTECTENTEKTFLKISVNSVVRKCLAHSFSHSRFSLTESFRSLLRKGQANGERLRSTL